MKEGTGITVTDSWEGKNKARIFKGHITCFPSVEIVIRTNRKWPRAFVSLDEQKARKLHKFLTKALQNWGPFNEDVLK